MAINNGTNNYDDDPSGSIVELVNKNIRLCPPVKTVHGESWKTRNYQIKRVSEEYSWNGTTQITLLPTYNMQFRTSVKYYDWHLKNRTRLVRAHSSIELFQPYFVSRYVSPNCRRDVCERTFYVQRRWRRHPNYYCTKWFVPEIEFSICASGVSRMIFTVFVLKNGANMEEIFSCAKVINYCYQCLPRHMWLCVSCLSSWLHLF